MRGQAQARCHLVILCPAEPRGQLYCVSRLSGATCSTLWPPTPNSPAAKHEGSECGFWSCAPGNRLPVTKYLLCDLRGVLGNVKYQDAVRHSSGAVLRVVRMSGGWQGRTAWGGDGVGGPAHPPGCCQKWAGMRELAYSVFTILMGHVDPPWRLCFLQEGRRTTAFSVSQGLARHHPQLLGLGSPLVSMASGCWVPRAKVTLLWATDSSVAKVSHELRDDVRGSGLVWEGSPRWYS